MRSKIQSYLKHIDLVFLFLIGAITTIPLEDVNPKAIFALFIVQFIFILKKRHINFKTNTFFWLLMAMYSLNLIGLLYTENLEKGFTMITRQISFVLFPLFYTSYYVKNVKLLFKAFCASIFAFILLFEAHTLYRFFYQSDIFPLDLELFLSFRYTGSELTKLIETHNAYFGMFIVLSNVIIVEFLKSSKKNIIILLLLFLIALQSMFLFQMVAKTAIILNVIIILPSLIYLLVSRKKFKTLLLVTALTFGIGLFVTSKFNLPLNRITERFQNINEGRNSEIETRVVIWQAAKETLQENLYFGTGTGDANTVLVKDFSKKGLKTNSNIHNQFLDYLLRFGIVGLLVLLSVFLYGFVIAIKLKNYIYFCFLLLIFGSCLTENILSRQWGIIFFTSFNYLLYLVATKTYKWE